MTATKRHRGWFARGPSRTRARRRMLRWYRYHTGVRNGDHIICTRGMERAYRAYTWWYNNTRAEAG